MDNKDVKGRPRLTIERARELLEYNPGTGVLTWRVDRRGGVRAGDVAGYDCRSTSTNSGLTYRIVMVDGLNYGAHRVCWAIHTGAWPVAGIDHINGTGNDNRINNLREVTAAINARNLPRGSNNTSGFTGVAWHRERRKWHAQITIGGRSRFLGAFTNLANAAAARKAADRRYGYSENHGRDPMPMASGGSPT